MGDDEQRGEGHDFPVSGGRGAGPARSAHRSGRTAAAERALAEREDRPGRTLAGEEAEALAKAFGLTPPKKAVRKPVRKRVDTLRDEED